MTIPLEPPVGLVAPFGYSAQTTLALYLTRHYYGNLYHIWFSLEFNPILNGDSANPLLIYQTLDNAVKKRDVNNPKIQTARMTLMSGVNSWLRAGQISTGLAASLNSDIARASLSWFRPVGIRIDLQQVNLPKCKTDAVTAGAQFLDEYLAVNLPRTAFEVAVW